MSWKIDYLPEHQVVRVTTSGRMTLELLKQMASDGLAEAAKHGASRFLVDHRAMTPDLETMDIYDLPRINLELGLQRAHRVAIVMSAATEKKADFKFYEDRAYNVGLAHRLFTDPETALAWLTGEDSASR